MSTSNLIAMVMINVVFDILGCYKTVEVGVNLTDVFEVFLKEVTLKLSPEGESSEAKEVGHGEEKAGGDLVLHMDSMASLPFSMSLPKMTNRVDFLGFCFLIFEFES